MVILPIDRFAVIQSIIHRIGAEKYLEIGVEEGNIFTAIECTSKVGVDPRPISDQIQSRISESVHYYPMTSDQFFNKCDETFDVIFIDGLHTYTQSLRDVEHALNFLNTGGFIIMHDCNPPDEGTGLPADSPADASAKAAKLEIPFSNTWTGDVWKTIVNLRTRPDLSVFVFDFDFGVGVVTKGRCEQVLSIQNDHIQKMQYSDLDNNRAELLNLKPGNYFVEFLRSLR